MSKANLSEQVQIVSVLAGTISANNNSTGGVIGKVSKGILLVNVISKNNNNDTAKLKVMQTPVGGSEAQVGSDIDIAVGAAAKKAPIVLTGLAPGGTLRINSSALSANASIVVDIVLIGFMGRRLPTTHKYSANQFDTDGITS